MDNLGDLIDRLSICNCKLFAICDKKADMAAAPLKYTKEEMAAVMAKDILLCKERAALKSAINKLSERGPEEVKLY